MIRAEDIRPQGESRLLRRTLSTLEKTTIIMLFFEVLIYLVQFFYVWLVVDAFVAIYLIFPPIIALVAGLILARMRWASLLGVFVLLVASTIDLSMAETSSTLLHPAVNPGHFGSLAFLFSFALIAIVSGSAATIQNYRVPGLATPRWLSSFVTGISCMALGMLVIALLVAANPVGAAASTSSNGLPTIHVAGSNFLTDVVLVPKGSKLQIIDDDGIEHILANGSWTASGTPEPLVEAGAPSIQALPLKSGSIEIGPFFTAGVFHIYCTVHRGMNLTIVVQ